MAGKTGSKALAFMDLLDVWVADNGTAVTYIWAARELGVPADTAKLCARRPRARAAARCPCCS